MAAAGHSCPARRESERRAWGGRLRSGKSPIPARLSEPPVSGHFEGSSLQPGPETERSCPGFQQQLLFAASDLFWKEVGYKYIKMGGSHLPPCFCLHS